jgi:hypothetical protein
MTKRKRTKRQENMIYKTLDRKQDGVTRTPLKTIVEQVFNVTFG